MKQTSLAQSLRFGLCAFAVLAASHATRADDPLPSWASKVVQVMNNGHPLDTGRREPSKTGKWFAQEEQGHAAPIYYDWDHDGRRDLIVGGFSGRFRLYLNSGSDTQPVFTDYQWIMQGKNPAMLRNFCCVAVGPRMVDLDGDGIDDLTAGSYEPGFIYWFRGTKNDGLMERHALLGYLGLPIMTRMADLVEKPYLSYAAKATWMDWDADGDQDLIIGDAEGDLVLRRNLGTGPYPGKTAIPEQPLFDTFAWSPGFRQVDIFTLVDGGAGPLAKAEDLSPTAADWNGDGLKDLVIGTESGAVYVLTNNGAKGKPHFAAPEQLLPGVPGGTFPLFQLLHEGDKIARGGRSSVDVVDVNGDGKPDLMVGDYARSLVLRDDLTAADMKALKAVEAKMVALDKRAGLKPPYDPLRDRVKATPIYYENKALAAELHALEKQLFKFLVPARKDHRDRLLGYERQHGHVWVYLRR